MGDVFKHPITRSKDASGRRVKAGTPGAMTVEEESRKWYSEYVDANGDR